MLSWLRAQLLGKRLGPAFKTLLPKFKTLPSETVQEFLATGELTLDGHVFNKDEVSFCSVAVLVWISSVLLSFRSCRFMRCKFAHKTHAVEITTGDCLVSMLFVCRCLLAASSRVMRLCMVQVAMQKALC